MANIFFISTNIILSVIMGFSSPNFDTPQQVLDAHKRGVDPQKTLDSIGRVNNASIQLAGGEINRAHVFLKEKDSAIYLLANMRLDHRFYGYAQPDTKSEKLILFSIFTNDVKDNPFGLKLGAYYGTSGMADNIQLKYIATQGNYIKAFGIQNNQETTVVYFEKKWIELK